jgi:5'-nucleotidase
MEQIGRVIVAAPDREMSGISHALSLQKPLRVKEVKEDWFAIGGTPTDCVYLGVHKLAGGPVDLVVSGINRGANLGEDVHYSGTVAGAVEGSLYGCAAIAFSQIGGDLGNESMGRASTFAVRLAKAVLASDIGKRPLLNVNFPPGVPRGVRLTRLGTRHYEDTLTEETDARGNRFFVIAGTAVHYDQDQDTDCQVAEERFISVTPLKLDLTDFEAQVKMADWEIFREET